MSADAQPGDFSKKTFKTFLLRVLAQALTIGAGIIIARSLGPAGKGMFTYVTVVLTLLVTLGGGSSAAVSRQYGREALQRRRVRGDDAVFLCGGVTCGRLLAAAAVFTHQTILLAPAIAFPFAYINQISVAFSLVEGDVAFANFQGLAMAAALTVVAAIFCFALHLDVTALLAGWIGVNAALCVYSLSRSPSTRTQATSSKIDRRPFASSGRSGFASRSISCSRC